jgi:hypothetical protein
MLPDVLNTNQVKDSAAAEVEFTQSENLGRTREFRKISETPNLPHRIDVKHAESGKGVTLRRDSVIIITKNVTGVDGSPVVIKGQVKLSIPVGNLATMAEPTHVLAEVGSLVFTLATSTFLYDGTGNGAVCLINGDL